MRVNSLSGTFVTLCACWAFSSCDAADAPDIAQGGNASNTGGGLTAGGGGVSAAGGAPVQGGGSSEAGGSSAVDDGSSGASAAGGSSSPLGGAPPSGGTSSTGGADGPDPSGGASSGGGTVASGGQPSGGRSSNLGGAAPSGGRSSNLGGAVTSGGTRSGGGSSATGGTSASCTDIVPPGNESCANAVAWGWCTADWIGDYCAAACGRCGSTSSGGTGAGGSATGGGSASPTGGTGSGDLSVPRLNGGQQATTTRYWDCCKPSCAWAGNVGGKQPATACGKDGNSTVGADAKNACESGGTAFQCNWGVPWQVGPSLSYGYAAFNSGGCGTCYQLDFPNGKTMIVQVINIGAMSGNNFDLLIPGGGVGAMNACTQNGSMWGNVNAGAQHGGFLATCGPNMSCITDMCQSAFGSNAALMAGCEWFTGWFGAQDNPNVTYGQTNCPADITNKSGLR